MKQYEKNIGIKMPIKNFGGINGEVITHCILKDITNCQGMVYFLELYNKDGHKLGGRWVTRHMYRFHVLGKKY